MPMAGREFKLRNALKEVEAQYDVIVFDAPPSFGLLNLNALMAANDLFVPVLADFLSFHGLKLLFETVQSLEEDLNHVLDHVFIVVNAFNADLQAGEGGAGGAADALPGVPAARPSSGSAPSSRRPPARAVPSSWRTPTARAPPTSRPSSTNVLPRLRASAAPGRRAPAGQLTTPFSRSRLAHEESLRTERVPRQAAPPSGARCSGRRRARRARGDAASRRAAPCRPGSAERAASAPEPRPGSPRRTSPAHAATGSRPRLRARVERARAPRPTAAEVIDGRCLPHPAPSRRPQAGWSTARVRGARARRWRCRRRPRPRRTWTPRPAASG